MGFVSMLTLTPETLTVGTLLFVETDPKPCTMSFSTPSPARYEVAEDEIVADVFPELIIRTPEI